MIKSPNVFQNVKWGFDNGMVMYFCSPEHGHVCWHLWWYNKETTMEHTACFGCRVLLGPSMLRWTKHVIVLLCSTRFTFETYLDLSTQKFSPANHTCAKLVFLVGSLGIPFTEHLTEVHTEVTTELFLYPCFSNNLSNQGKLYQPGLHWKSWSFAK